MLVLQVSFGIDRILDLVFEDAETLKALQVLFKSLSIGLIFIRLFLLLSLLVMLLNPFLDLIIHDESIVVRRRFT
jgi:hypothetical protein